MRFPARMCEQQRLRSARAYAQSDQSLCSSLEYSMIVKLLTEHHLEFLGLKLGCRARPGLHMSKCHIVGNLMHWLIYTMHNKFSNCFVWVSPSALDLSNFICCHEDTSADHLTRFSI